MKTFAVTVAFIALSSISASAAGPRPSLNAPVIDPTYDWSGFYIGANAGYGWARNEHEDIHIDGDKDAGFWTDKSFGRTQAVNPSGATYGGQIGYNWQVMSWVFGLEGQFNGANLKRTDISIFFPESDFLSAKIDSFGTITARVGYAFDNWLPYIKGGYAAAHLETKNSDIFNRYLDHSAWRSGYVVGAGLEYAFATNWVLGIEYNYMDFGGKSFSGAIIRSDGTPFNKETFDDKLKLSTVTARLSYKFGGPKVTRY